MRLCFLAAAAACLVGLEPIAAKPLEPLDLAAARRDVDLGTTQPRADVRDTAVGDSGKASYDLAWQAQDKVLFTTDEPSLAPLQLPNVTLRCIECRTWGTLTADAESPALGPVDGGDLLGGDLGGGDLFRGASLSVVFRGGAGAHIRLGLFAARKTEYAVPLFKSVTPLGASGPNFQLGVVFSVDLVFATSGELDATGGFDLSIPDGAALVMPLDPTESNTASFNGTSFSLLPYEAPDTPANLTISLRVGVKAGLEFKAGLGGGGGGSGSGGADVGVPLSAQALVGAYLNVPEVILTEGGGVPEAAAAAAGIGSGDADADAACVPASAEANVNAGVYVDVGADAGRLQVAKINPTASTTFLRAATSSCLGGGGGSQHAPTPSATMAYPTEAAAAAATSSGGAAAFTPLATPEVHTKTGNAPEAPPTATATATTAVVTYPAAAADGGITTAATTATTTSSKKYAATVYTTSVMTVTASDCGCE